jgi:hypothetical protein
MDDQRILPDATNPNTHLRNGEKKYAAEVRTAFKPERVGYSLASTAADKHVNACG